MTGTHAPDERRACAQRRCECGCSELGDTVRATPVLIAYPRLSERDLGLVRIAGPGLGNLLFPWARAVCFARRLGVPLLWPTWPQVKLGPILRKEVDKRFYISTFAATPAYVSGWPKLRCLFRWPRVPEQLREQALQDRRTNRLLVFEGLSGLFEELRGNNALILDELLSIARAPHRSAWRGRGNAAIAIHVRHGDLQPAPNAQLLRDGVIGYRLPMSWYVALTSALRARLPNERIVIFSDGRDEDLAPLFALGASRAPRADALSDLLAMASARLLVGSASTFSLWASYLGGMPTAWHPGQLMQRLHSDVPDLEVELEQSARLPESWLAHLKP